MKIENNLRFDFSNYKGKGVKCAVVDSGIDLTNTDVKGVLGGIKIEIDSNGQILYSHDYVDYAGHGTACSKIIRRLAPDVQLYSVKILDEELKGHGMVLAEAIRWSAKAGMNIVNMSLGTTDKTYEAELRNSCANACEKGIILVAAVENMGMNSYPAIFPNVIGVTNYNNNITNMCCHGVYDYFYRPGDRVEFATNERSSSFAAAKITGLVALILEKYPTANLHKVKKNLIANASSSQIDEFKEKQFSEMKEDVREHKKRYSWIKKAVLYPYSEKMHNFIRFRNLLDFEIVGVTDFLPRKQVGKDAGEIIGIEHAGLQITHDIVSAMKNSDTLILGDVNKELISLKEVLTKAIEHGQNIYSFKKINDTELPDVLQIAEERGLKLCYPDCPKDISVADSYSDIQMRRVNVPVLGVFATGRGQGSFTTELTLRKKLIQEGYKLGQMGTEPYCELFGFDVAFPIHELMMCSSNKIPKIVSYIERKKMELYERRKTDIIIVGVKGGIIPYDLSWANIHIFPSILFLLATKPDAYILVVDASAPLDYVQDSIDALRILGKGETILLVIDYNTTLVKSKVIQNGQLETALKSLEDKFGIPATEVISKAGQEKLAKVVKNYYAAE